MLPEGREKRQGQGRVGESDETLGALTTSPLTQRFFRMVVNGTRLQQSQGPRLLLPGRGHHGVSTVAHPPSLRGHLHRLLEWGDWNVMCSGWGSP